MVTGDLEDARSAGRGLVQQRPLACRRAQCGAQPGEIREAVGQPLRVQAGLVVAQDRGHGGEHLVGIDRLDQIRVGAALQPAGTVDRLDRRGRDVDHRRRAVHRIALDELADLEPGDVRKAYVEHDEVYAALAETAQGFGARRCLDHGVATAAQPAAEHVPFRCSVVDEE